MEFDASVLYFFHNIFSMTDNSTRHIIAFLATAAFVVVFLAGYVAGTLGWWLSAVVVLVIYPIVYKLVNPSSGGGHH